jgi:hypothetical protein
MVRQMSARLPGQYKEVEGLADGLIEEGGWLTCSAPAGFTGAKKEKQVPKTNRRTR